MQETFQAGVDSIYNAIVGQGVTPAGKTPADMVTGIGTVATNKYDIGNSDGYSSGYTQGVNDSGQKYFWCDVAISGVVILGLVTVSLLRSLYRVTR